MTITIRPANADELGVVAQIERDADELFRTVGLDAIPDGAPTPPNAYAPSQAAGRLLVAVTEAGRVAGFVRIELVDGLPHLEQVSVRPADARRGLGRSLMTAAEDWARRRGHTHLTLTTYRDVPWNGPSYERLGWQAIPDADLTPGLRAVRARERAAGLDARPRLAMTKALATTGQVSHEPRRGP